MTYLGLNDLSAATPGAATAALADATKLVYSDKILQEQLGVMNWLPFARLEDGLMNLSGETVRVIKRNALHGNATVGENEFLPSALGSSSAINVTVTEWGMTTRLTEKLRHLSWDNQVEQAAYDLGKHYTQWGPDYLLQCAAFGYDLDLFGPRTFAQLQGRYAFNQAKPTVYYSNAGDIVNGRAHRDDIVAGDIITIDTVIDLCTILKTRNVPKFNDGTGSGFYVMVLHPNLTSHITADPNFVAADHTYGRWMAAQNAHQTGRMFTGEIGRWNDVVFIESANVPNGLATVATTGLAVTGSQGFEPSAAYDATAGTPVVTNGLASGVTASTVYAPNASPGANQADIYRSVIFGADYLTFAEVLPAEIRQAAREDHGRFHSFGWYSIYGADRLEPTHGIVVESTRALA